MYRPTGCGLGLSGEHQFPAAGADSVGKENQIESLGRSRRECHIDSVGILGHVDDAIAVAILGSRSGGFDQNPRELAAQNLQLRRRAVVGSVAGREGRDGGVGVVDEAGALLGGAVREEGRVQTHAPQYLAAGAANVDVLAAQSQLRCAFEDGDLEACPVQPERHGGTGDAGTGDEYTRSHGARMPGRLIVQSRRESS
ncbi:MAG: hypothetical protein U5N21_01710 [Rhodococcus sp. (in: high G+C Gram-positive bacteria)]|nr:hypothetical protein [Rhodococcus sp. (in: high G+C Gram-positive bacteria)]